MTPDESETDSEWPSPLREAIRCSRYARRLVLAQPELVKTLDASHPFRADAMRELIVAHAPDDEPALARVLRELRKRVMLRLIVRDLAGWADLAEVTATVTSLADVTIDEASTRLDAFLRQQYGAPTGHDTAATQCLMVVGMGKLGGRELNVSSDIDLIFLYAEDGDTSGPRVISNFEYFTRLARKLIATLGEITAEGFVFRVDMRLRPYGDSGPLVCNLTMLENYLITQGREWERYAWIKARLIAGGHEPELTALVQPFVFRRHLDYGAFDSMRNLHAQIRQEVNRRDMADNIKLGPGGIREIEFTAQVFQLIRGGREAALRIQPTLAVLCVLGERRLLPEDAVAELSRAYDFLRRLEHRLQYLDDQQTQSLPRGEADRSIIATAMGFASWHDFRAELDRHRGLVSHHFEQIFAAPADAREDPAAGTRAAGSPGANVAVETELVERRLQELGYPGAQALAARVVELRTGSRYRQMPASGQARIDRLLPRVLEAAAAHSNRNATADSLLKLIEAIGRRESYLALLVEYPQCLAAVAKLAATSSWAADYLGQHPILLDELLDTRALHAPVDMPAMGRALAAQLAEHAGDTERQMDTLRHYKHAQTFRLLAQDLAGELPLETLSDHLSDLACVCLDAAMKLAWENLRIRHRPEPRFAIVGYGKLGGKELGYASDLDIIFLYDDPAPEAAEVYARYALRINFWLTTVTPAGVLYETDLRLRPDGASGLMVSPFEAFEAYQRQKAWVWEHQALTRARHVAGDAGVGQRFDALRCEILRERRDPAVLKREITAMRAKMLDAHPNRSALFDLKHDRGGIIDVEFIVQYLVLAHASVHAELTANSGNLALILRSAQLGLIPLNLAQAVHAAYRTYRKLQHGLRLRGERYARIETASVAPQIEAVRRLWEHVFGACPKGGDG
ncbi:MAG: bifunctional [glutamate--ammonia ligase]-adenylyl-L-tyrosine phosphorylase/[glutamate--ammonia-ligase] adenylyltransferase [Betaproteobacteria bacterium]|nr:MAG: bifunctional [glutamate--ammonia ligase]-adenylyl-L-tyrosine phosphorylase/[glutamate--ammonia-ligase] adenylyltransferase [Betaproteobacteria bacterium]